MGETSEAARELWRAISEPIAHYLPKRKEKGIYAFEQLTQTRRLVILVHATSDEAQDVAADVAGTIPNRTSGLHFYHHTLNTVGFTPQREAELHEKGHLILPVLF